MLFSTKLQDLNWADDICIFSPKVSVELSKRLIKLLRQALSCGIHLDHLLSNCLLWRQSFSLKERARQDRACSLMLKVVTWRTENE